MTVSIRPDRAVVQRSPGRQAWDRFRRHRLAMLGSVCVLLVAASAILAPFISGQDPLLVDLAAYRLGPNADHVLGTDSAGRDVFSRLLHGGRISLTVGLVAVAVATSIGLTLGAVSGYYGGWTDVAVMRLTDVVLSFPVLIVVITVVALVGPSIYVVMFAIGLFGWPTVGRLVRGMTLSVRERDFIQAARAVGASDARIMFRHILPQVVSPVTVAATFGVAQAILLEAALSFLGLGVRPPQPSWGNMLSDAQSLVILQDMPWMWAPPGLMITVAVLSINLVGDGLRDALDPRFTL
jgi:ABC-type dipeptide/oligopeptide/nickel transport system permease subunit